MAEIKPKRQRTANYTQVEKNIFIDLVQQFKGILENPKTDGLTLKRKETAWSNLSVKFNNHAAVTQRTIRQLKTLYDNLKRSARKEDPDGRIEIFKKGITQEEYLLRRNQHDDEYIYDYLRSGSGQDDFFIRRTEAENQLAICEAGAVKREPKSGSEEEFSDDSRVFLENSQSGSLQPEDETAKENQNNPENSTYGENGTSTVTDKFPLSQSQEIKSSRMTTSISDIKHEFSKQLFEEFKLNVLQKRKFEEELYCLEKEVLLQKKRAQTAKALYYETKLLATK